MDQRLLDDLLDWLRIPSISTGGGDPADLERAAAWVAQRVSGAGGEARVVATEGNPLAVGELRAEREDAPTVLIYGHYDVQSAGDLDAWTTPPFAPDVRDGRIYARGASDDKGNFLPLLHVACAQAAQGSLPVNVRVLVEGEEETGGDAVAQWVRADDRGADCAIVFDSGMVDERTPAITVGLRGLVMAHLQVRTAERDLHSGVYGGSALNALHALHAMLAAVVPGPDGSLRDELRAGIAAARAGRARVVGAAAARRRVAARRRGAPRVPWRGRGVLRAKRRRHVARDQRHPRRRAPHRGAGGGARERLAAPGARAERARRPRHARAPAARGRCRPGPSSSCRPSWASPRCSRPTTPPSRCRRRPSSGRSGRRRPSCAAAARSRSWPSSPPATSRPSSPASAWRTTPTTRPTSPSGSSRSTRARPPRRALPGARRALIGRRHRVQSAPGEVIELEAGCGAARAIGLWRADPPAAKLRACGAPRAPGRCGNRPASRCPAAGSSA